MAKPIVKPKSVQKIAPNVSKEILKQVKSFHTSPKSLKRGDYVWVFQDGNPKTQFAVQVTDTWVDEESGSPRDNIYGIDYKWLKKLGGDGAKHYASRYRGSDYRWEDGDN